MIFMFVVVDIELEMGYTVVVKVFRAVASIMEVMVNWLWLEVWWR